MITDEIIQLSDSLFSCYDIDPEKITIDVPAGMWEQLCGEMVLIRRRDDIQEKNHPNLGTYPCTKMTIGGINIVRRIYPPEPQPQGS